MHVVRRHTLVEALDYNCCLLFLLLLLVWFVGVGGALLSQDRRRATSSLCPFFQGSSLTLLNPSIFSR